MVDRLNPRRVSGDHSTRRRAVADEHLPLHRVVLGECWIRYRAGVAHLTRRHDALDRVSPAVGRFDEPQARRRCPDDHVLPDCCARHPSCELPGPTAADVRSLMGVGRTA